MWLLGLLSRSFDFLISSFPVRQPLNLWTPQQTSGPSDPSFRQLGMLRRRQV